MKYIKQKKLITAFVSTLFSALPLAMAHAASDNSAVFNTVIEAEDYTDISDVDNDSVGDFIQSSREDASSGNYMQAKGLRDNSYLEYQINLPADDVYHIAVRGTGAGKSANSFFVSVDGGINSRVNLKSDDSWGWKTVVDVNSGLGPYSLSKGNHRIRIKQRERNAKLDQLKITGTRVIVDNPGVVNIRLEAEDYSAISDADNNGVDDFIQSSRADASSGNYMQAKGQRDNSYLEYQINLPADDVYDIAVRGTGTSNSSNSFFVSVDSGVNSKVHLKADDSWDWKTVVDANSGLGPYSLSAGRHTVRIYQRERNTKLDQLQITNTAGANFPVASLSRSNVNFGNQDVGSVSGSEKITLSNNGSVPLTISRINTTADFSQTSNCEFVPVNASCNINLVYTPSSVGGITGAVNIISNAKNSPTWVTLSGRGAAGKPVGNEALHVDFNKLPLGLYKESDARSDFNVGRNNWVVGPGDSLEIVRDPANAGHGKVLRALHLKGKSGGKFDIRADIPPADEYYFAYDFYVPSDWWQPKQHKMPGLINGTRLEAGHAFGVKPAAKTLPAFTALTQSFSSVAWGGRGDGSLSAYYYDKDRVQRDDFLNTVDPTSGAKKGQYRIPRGQWIKIEQYIKLNTINKKDGELKMWVNGVLMSDVKHRWRADLSYPGNEVDNSARRINGVWVFSFYGGNIRNPDNKAPKDQYQYYDNFIVSDSPITH